jgi:rhodanese-related sulfurtransferase
MKKILVLVAFLSVSLFAQFKTIDVAEFEKLQSQGVPVIDIRTPMEWQKIGVIKGAKKMMFFSPKGEALVADWFFELGHFIKDKKQPFIIYCAHANRSKTLGKGLEAMGFENVYELKGGIENGWIKAGKSVVK